MRRSWIVVCRGSRVDLLMSEPSFRLQKPAVSKIAFVSENSRIPIDPIMVEWGERKVRVVYPLLIGDPSRITTVKPGGVEIECQQLVLVRPIADVEISLPQLVLAVITLPVCGHEPAINAKFQRSHSLLNHIVIGIISVSATDLFSIEIPGRTRRRMFGYKVHYWRWFRTVKQTVAAADGLNLAYALRQRQIVKSREANPITHEWQAVPKDQSEL